MNTLLLVDGSSYLYRAFHAMPDLRSPSGQATGAIYGVLNMLRQLKKEYSAPYQACIFDAKGKTFRDDMYSEYKANRPPMPEDLRSQVDIVHQLVACMGWHVLVVDKVEADDVIGTLAYQAEQQGFQVVISTGDKDMAQLVTANVSLINTMSHEHLDEQGVKNKFGVEPKQIIDYLALMGDKVDNVPGVEKCGPKTAVKWLEEFGSLDAVVANAGQIKGKVGENLKAALDFLPLAKQLVTIKCDVDLSHLLPNGIEDLQAKEPNWQYLYENYQQLGFKTWTKEAQQNINTTENMSLFTDVATESDNVSPKPFSTPVELHYQAITTEKAFKELLEKLDKVNQIGLDTETTSLNTLQARLVGISIAFAAGEAAYIPLTHSLTALTEQLPLEETLFRLKPYLESEQLSKIGQNLKYDQHIFANHDIQLNGIIGDSMLASYVVESHLSHGLDDLAPRHLGLATTTYESLCGKGAKQISFADVALRDATAYACQDADFALRLENLLRGKMNKKQTYVYEQIELPVASILFKMERLGVLLNKTELARQSHELGKRLLELEQQAHEMAGQPFNLNSPKQLQEILFNRLGIPIKGLKKTASGGISTDERVLEKLALDYPLPKLILENRTLAKLKTTYTDKLPILIHPDDGRVHTTYAQAVAITGRLASNNPNLQNIPIRTEEGRRVRKAFIAAENCLVISADYSQIELRIMAHLSNDPALIKAFNEGADIHRATAAEVFHVEQSEVTSEQRRYAKTINFGLIYGMGQYGLANSLEISPTMAKQFIDRYFMKYPAVAQYMEEAKHKAQEQGFVETLFGRRLYLPDIHSPKANIRAGAERAAINAPMQGTASDLIKLAMIALQNWLRQEQLKSKLIMQVHDELVLEVPLEEKVLVIENLPKLMASVALLNVPLLAEVGVGQNWDEAH